MRSNDGHRAGKSRRGNAGAAGPKVDVTPLRQGRVVFLSNHVLDSARRAGFHWLADAFWTGGWDVTFVTTGISIVSKLRHNSRFTPARPSGIPIELAPRLTMYIEPAFIHPAYLSLPLLSAAASIAMARYGQRLSDSLKAFVKAADLVVFESNASLMMFEAVRQATNAKLAYRVSDDVRVIRNSRLVRMAEDAVIDRFDCVSVPSRALLQSRFACLKNAVYQPHGVPDFPPLSQTRRYSGNSPIATSIGSTLLDYEFLRLAPSRRPAVTFHQVGQMITPVKAHNLVTHGEVPYADTVDFAAQADLCLALYEDHPDSIYLAETSNKLALFMALRKRIVAPKFLQSSLTRPGIFFYDVKNPHTIDDALDAALEFDPADVPTVKHSGWAEVRDGLLNFVGMPKSSGQADPSL
jgi:2-beta-glucuronyltransferase